MKIIIIGAGARGLMCARGLLEKGIKPTLIEHSRTTGKKILITGKGRCNVTNDCDEREFLNNIRTNSKFLYSSIYGFNCRDTMRFFESHGVPLKTERGRRVFPVSDKAKDIKDALDKRSRGSDLIMGDVKEILFDGERAAGVLLSGGRKLFSDRVVVATGGLSYSYTGSTGDGYKFARQAGHRVVAPSASLVSLVEGGSECKKMAGLSLKNVALTLKLDQKNIWSGQGEMLFTHYGISGPLTLSASCFIDDGVKGYTAHIDLKPALSFEKLYARVCRDLESLGAKKTVSSLDRLLPRSMIPVMLDRWGVDKYLNVNQINREERRKLVSLLKDFEIPIKCKYDIETAVITRGGVDVAQINPSTMESKLKNGLYFIGEVLDVDGYTGGYNLQTAFSTGRNCAASIAEKYGLTAG